jgi:hypothetical protein
MNQETINAYIDVLRNTNEDDAYEVIQEMTHSDNVIEKSFAFMIRRFSPDSLLYNMPCLFYRDGNWYKYSGHNPERISMNAAILLIDQELFKLVKRNLLSNQKRIIMNMFLRNGELVLHNLNTQKTHLGILKNLTIHSDQYIIIKAVMEYLFTFDDKIYLDE